MDKGMRRDLLVIVLVGALGAAATAMAQEAGALPNPVESPATVPGWSITPTVGVSRAWDDNVLIQSNAGPVSSDVVSVLTPQASLAFNGPHSRDTPTVGVMLQPGTVAGDSTVFVT